MSAYLVISILKNSPIPEKQIRIFLSYLTQEPLKEYLTHSNIYKGKKNGSKYDLIDMIISGKYKTKPLSPDDEDLSIDQANTLLKHHNFRDSSSEIIVKSRSNYSNTQQNPPLLNEPSNN